MGDGAGVPPGGRRRLLRTLTRTALVLAALGVSGFVLVTAFDDLDAGAIAEALRSLGDAELLALGAMWALWIAAQGLQTAALIHDLPVRRGVIAFLGPGAIASVIPGPSDLPVRFRMLTSWGYERGDATVAVAAGGIFSIGIKLVLPVIAALGLLASDAPIEGSLRTVVTVAIIAGAGLGVVGVVLSSTALTERAGRLLEPIWRTAMRLLRKPAEGDLADRLLAARARALATLRGRWLTAAWGTSLTAAARFALLLMALRFTGTDDSLVGWTDAFVVYALVQGLTVLPLTAGDAGVSEVALISLLTLAAGTAAVNEVTAAVILFRLLTWVALIPVGLGALVVWRRSVRTGDPAG